MHLINNAVAHGIEEPEQRSACGKPSEGQITIYASQKGNLIHLDVSDDGKGMDVDEIRLKAIADGIISASEAEDMDNSEVLELIFHPGFSTQKQVTELAGRGMGMSVVLDVMRELTGNIHIHSKLGQGTRFSMIFPVSLTVQQAKFFRIGKQRFGMLSNLIAQVMPLQQQQIKTASGPFRKGYIHYQGHRVPIINLHDVLVGGATKPNDKPEYAKILVVEHLEGFLAMIVDEVLEKTEVMVRELDPYLKHYHPIGLMGCTIVDDGSVQLLLEPNGLKEMWRTAPDGEVAQVTDTNAIHAPLFDQHILLVDDSTIALNLEKKMFEHMGFKVDTAISGSDALGKVDLNHYALMVTDLEMPDIDGITLIQRLHDDLHDKLFPIIMIATRDIESERQRALDAGAQAYFVKAQLKNEQKELLKTLTELLHT
jgi:chemotaxis protein histidine kinase CheA/ActR/RegA family two-component response regulator